MMWLDGGIHMDPNLRHALIRCETDIEGALLRLSNDESMYLSCLALFLDDRTTQDLGNAIHAKKWDDAFTAAHALKGVAGNMGFIPLFHATAEIVVLIRAGKIHDIEASYQELQQHYQRITTTIRDNLPNADRPKGETL